LSLLDSLVNIVLVFEPTKLIEAKHARTTKASITAYSTAVGPSLETRKRRTFRATNCIFNTLRLTEFAGHFRKGGTTFRPDGSDGREAHNDDQRQHYRVFHGGRAIVGHKKTTHFPGKRPNLHCYSPILLAAREPATCPTSVYPSNPTSKKCCAAAGFFQKNAPRRPFLDAEGFFRF
jgi:hypothetical protein